MTDAVTLWGHWTCPFVNRVDFALAERGIAHDLVSVPPSAVRPADFVLPEEFVAHSPLLEVPMIRIGGEFRVDSIPLLYWLEERVDAPALLPDDDGLVRERVDRLDATLMRAMGAIAYGTDGATIDRGVARLADAFAEIDAWLGDDSWLAGDRPTLAEAIAVPVYLRLPGLVALGYDRPIPDRVAEHRTRTLDRPGGRHVAWSPDQAAEYLGRHRAFRRRNGR
ncbi:MAG: glutathione S-transferase family protein [Acidimicrobiales bacterium]|nr:glutathione S-transferase family protein [Acidimicrobiales bacterium]